MRIGIIFFSFILLSTLGIHVPEVSSSNSYQAQMIPDEAIRLRILANSDHDDDQQIKRLVRDEVNAYITEKVQYIDDLDVGRKMIAESVPEIQTIAAQTLANSGLNQTVQVEYGTNISFPLKVYDHYVYPAGEYEAVLITIGEGKGANWWCVLFPPLCFLDFSNGTVVAEETAEIEEITDDPEQAEDEEEVVVKFFLFEWLGLS